MIVADKLGTTCHGVITSKLPVCGNAECSISTGIHEGLTFGSGELDSHGFWSQPCGTCARAWERAHPEDGACLPKARESSDCWPGPEDDHTQELPFTD